MRGQCVGGLTGQIRLTSLTYRVTTGPSCVASASNGSRPSCLVGPPSPEFLCAARSVSTLTSPPLLSTIKGSRFLTHPPRQTPSAGPLTKVFGPLASER